MKTLATIKMFVLKHKVAFAITGTTALLYTINRLALKQHDDFLKEHGLYDEFYALED